MAKVPQARKRTKILVGIADGLLTALNKLVEASCFRRDALLERIIAAELDNLESEVPIANTVEAREHIGQKLKELRRSSITLSLESQTIRRLDDICDRKRIPRDAFFNRLVYCLVASKPMLNALFSVEDYENRVIEDFGSPAATHAWQFLRMTPEYVTNPFWFLRACIELSNEDTGGEPATFYTVVFPDNLFGISGKPAESGKRPAPSTLGLNVYLPDGLIPGHPSHAAMLAELDIIFETLPKRRVSK